MSRLTVMQDMGKDIKDAVRALHEMGNHAEDCIYLLQTSFIYNSQQHLNDCRVKLADIINTAQEVTRKMEELSVENPILKPYESVPASLRKIGGSIDRLAQLIDRKVREGILFSDKAIVEITFLFQRLIDLLGPTSDIILARNQILSSYVQESEVEVVKKALEYATLHEERLIEGVCLHMASTLYLSMLDEIKNIAWHSKEIAVKLMA
ncbi:MAG: hypothetical protein AB1632_00655 [Nitrospirota bacterium]